MIASKKESHPEIETEVLIVGFGFSSIPLIRELENTGTHYIIVAEETEDTPIWENLDRNNRLDVDLEDWVTSIENYDDYSIGYKKKGSH